MWCAFRFVYLAALAVGVFSAINRAQAVEPGLSGEVSYERLKLPKTEFTYVLDNTNPNAPTGVVSKDVNHDGQLDGARIDLSWGQRTMFYGMPIVAGIKGYYSRHDSNQTSTCLSTSLAALCSHTPLFDPDANTQQVVPYGPGSNVLTTTDLATVTWGIALEAQTTSARSSAGTVDMKVGGAYRRLDTSLSLNGSRVSGGLGTPIPYTLDEDNNTGYLGGYVGAVGRLALGYGFAVTLDGDVGVYWGHTDYQGQYASSGGGTTNVSQSLSLDRDAAAVIAGLKLSLDKDFGGIKAGIFARGEVYSYAPEMRYNDVDRAVTFPAAGGHNDGTSIGRGSATTASVGARVTVPFGQ